jgi:rhodanese-related sulfurtransferase
VDGPGLSALLAERERRTVYLFDVRSPEEYADGHLPGALSAPGGQLVQATDSFMAVRNATLVLVDTDGVRARMTAGWLIQLGWADVHVLDDAAPWRGPLEKGPTAPVVLGRPADIAFVSPSELKTLGPRAVVVDLESSLRYREGHVPGAWFAIRSRLVASLPKIATGEVLVLTSADGALAELAAPEAMALVAMPVKVLRGGTAAWAVAGHALESGETRLADSLDDAYYRPYDRAADVEAAMRRYLEWEVGLADQIARDGDARFNLP